MRGISTDAKIAALLAIAILLIFSDVLFLGSGFYVRDIYRDYLPSRFVLRSVVAGSGLGLWAGEHSLTILNEVTLFLPVRWGIGLVGPFVLAIMAWQTARIRSTQSATGILYVVVILTFLGELVSQVLLRNDLLYAVKGGPLS